MNQPLLPPEGIPELADDMYDRAYDVMCGELDHWQVAGPMVDPGTKKQFWTAARKLDADGYAPPSAIHAPVGPQDKVHFQHFKDKGYAVAYIQYNSLRAVLNDPEIRQAIIAKAVTVRG